MVKWFRQIDSSATVSDVLFTVREYIATWTPEDLALLPASCRPGRMRDPQDVAELHGSLVDEYRVSRATGDELKRLQEMTSFVVRASIRLAELGFDSGPTTDGSENPGDVPSRSASPPPKG
jgi:hypothetical protein